MARGDLTDEEWWLIEPHLPLGERGPIPDLQLRFNVVMWRCRTGSPWRDLPAEYGPWSTVCDSGSHDYIGAPWPVRLEVKGDSASISVAAASVLAKVRRDAYMGTIGCAEYGFADNAGYPSPVHQEALARLGPTEHHRLSWSYLDDLPRWRHLKRHRDPAVGEGQASLFG